MPQLNCIVPKPEHGGTSDPLEGGLSLTEMSSESQNMAILAFPVQPKPLQPPLYHITLKVSPIIIPFIVLLFMHLTVGNFSS